jgi:hypothetical protein
MVLWEMVFLEDGFCGDGFVEMVFWGDGFGEDDFGED